MDTETKGKIQRVAKGAAIFALGAIKVLGEAVALVADQAAKAAGEACDVVKKDDTRPQTKQQPKTKSTNKG